MPDSEIEVYVRRSEELWMSYLESEYGSITQFIAENRTYLTEFIQSRQSGR